MAPLDHVELCDVRLAQFLVEVLEVLALLGLREASTRLASSNT
jgi:hypothetical protein